MGVGREGEKTLLSSSSFLPLFSFHSIILRYNSKYLHHTFTGFYSNRLSTNELRKQKMGFEKAMTKSAWWKCKNGVGIQEQNPPFQTLFPLRLTVIYCVTLLMTNIDCKIVVFFSIKIVFFAQSMHKACKPFSLTSLPSLAFYSFTMFTNLKINILMFFAPVSLFFCVSIEKQKLEQTCSHFTFYALYNVKLLRLPKVLNTELRMCPK